MVQLERETQSCSTYMGVACSIAQLERDRHRVAVDIQVGCAHNSKHDGRLRARHFVRAFDAKRGAVCAPLNGAPSAGGLPSEKTEKLASLIGCSGNVVLFERISDTTANHTYCTSSIHHELTVICAKKRGRF